MGPEHVVSNDMRDKRRNGIIWLVLALILAMVLGFSYRTDRRADDGDKKLAASSSQVDALKGQVTTNGQLAQSAKDAADEANRRLAAAGKPTVPVPSQPPVTPSTPPEGAQGPPDLRVHPACRESKGRSVSPDSRPCASCCPPSASDPKEPPDPRVSKAPKDRKAIPALQVRRDLKARLDLKAR
jgi:hypothetical protein